ncbi:hypothetical protein [Pinirhizobacter soli]|uniref:hypothetical protein n=1 Tax=Pinirhizobacter soli TaxID=2786953 RepID=UPI00202A51BF|nr:hypothetical protein [Pinirhizobacter soli]
MKRVLASMVVILGLAGCGDAQEQAAKDAGYILRMNDVVCHVAATELTEVTIWLRQAISENPKLAEFVAKGSAEADKVYSQHRKESDGDQRDASECKKVVDMAHAWHV